LVSLVNIDFWLYKTFSFVNLNKDGFLQLIFKDRKYKRKKEQRLRSTCKTVLFDSDLYFPSCLPIHNINNNNKKQFKETIKNAIRN